MYRLATKCTTKTTYKPASQNTVISFLALRVGTVPFSATAGLCRVPTACAQRCADCEFADADPQ